ncbi:cytochrome P450 [Xylaria bambusicola]|uniref:cytochrome P450 n=1 Tax=Xylaria bambusicola TaxID=326684 RepID=UPI00200792BA|nr:cytochrome P450 [Xylaria bambusicola]KAI0522073.1 cytochrome P450 [Xylaria bambusicola]
MPKKQGHLQFEKWAKEYGPIYSLVLGTQIMIVLSSDLAVKDLLDKRSGIYSSRPDMYLGQDITSGGFRMVLMEYGERWRIERGIVHNSLNIKASRTYVPYQDLESKAMLLGFLDNPSQFFNHIRRYTNSISTQMIFGFRTLDIHDPKLERLIHGFEKWSEIAGSQSAALLDVFPILRHLPDFLLPAKKYARKLHEKEYDLFVGHYLTAKRKLKEGKSKPCICADVVRAQDEIKFSDGVAGYLSGTLLEAGSDTSASTLIGFIQALLIFPEVPVLAQEELDRVCGDRIPDLNDLPDLPYIRGCIKESMRWMPTAILGVPHAVTRDDEYSGYHIPKGAGVMLNVWAIHNDPHRHPDPRRFDPNRWIQNTQTSAEAANNADVSKRDQFVFGAGRRLCQGIHIADRNLFLAISRLLWAFDFRRPIDKSTGKEIIPDMEDLTEGLLVCPNAFRADIKPRSSLKADIVRSEWKKMTELLDDDLQWKSVPEGLVWRDYEPRDSEEM